jgi:acyl carrier protein
MIPEEVRRTVLACLGRVAPEADVANLRGDLPIRDQVDLDSMDFLRFVIEIDETLHVAVPESEYAELATLDGCVRYLGARLPDAVR